MKQEAIIEKGIAKIFEKQLKGLVDILLQEVKSYEKKGIEDRIREYLETIKIDVPNYLFTSLQPIMQKAYKRAVKDYKKYLKDTDYNLIFNVPNTSAVRFLQSRTDIHLSDQDGSINKTTKKEVLTLISDGLKGGKSYTEIARDIQESNPFVFGKERAKLIAIQEVGQAYGYSSFEPARRMKEQGYIMEKKWLTVKDERVRDSHRANESEGFIAIDKIFSGTGDMYGPSSDYRCRCRTITKIVG